MARRKFFEVYTDGSCKGRWGAWAFVLLQDGNILQELSGRALKTNSNRMEFQAAIEGLRATPVGAQVIVYTDYRVLVSNVSQFSEWEAVHWQKKQGRLIPNSDQFIALQQLIKERSVVFQWVKAHVGNTYNERCDQLCALSREGA